MAKFRKHVTPFLTDRDGNPVYNELGQREPNPDAIIEPYQVPVIVYKDKFGVFQGPVRGFKPIIKLSIIRDNEELSTYVDQTYQGLQQHRSFQEIQRTFANHYSETRVYGNALFVNHVNSVRLP